MDDTLMIWRFGGFLDMYGFGHCLKMTLHFLYCHLLQKSFF